MSILKLSGSILAVGALSAHPVTHNVVSCALAELKSSLAVCHQAIQDFWHRPVANFAVQTETNRAQQILRF